MAEAGGEREASTFVHFAPRHEGVVREDVVFAAGPDPIQPGAYALDRRRNHSFVDVVYVAHDHTVPCGRTVGQRSATFGRGRAKQSRAPLVGPVDPGARWDPATRTDRLERRARGGGYARLQSTERVMRPPRPRPGNGAHAPPRRSGSSIPSPKWCYMPRSVPARKRNPYPSRALEAGRGCHPRRCGASVHRSPGVPGAARGSG